MKIKDLVINEGVIEVPPELVERCMNELKKMVANYIYHNITYRELVKYITIPDFIPIKSYGSYQPNWVTLTEINYNTEIVKYAQSERWSTIILGAVNDPDGTHLRNTTKGQYEANSKTLLINITSLIKDLDDEIDMTRVFDSDEEYRNSSPDEIEEIMATNAIDEWIGGYIREFFSLMSGTLEHELAHHIQYEFLRGRHTDQVQRPKSNSRDDYLTSNVEYSPQIISSANAFVHEMKRVRRFNHPKKFESIWAKYITGSISLGTAIDETESIKGIPEYYDDYNMHEKIASNRHFFMALKKKDRKQWKKAVKYFYSKVNDSLDALDP